MLIFDGEKYIPISGNEEGNKEYLTSIPKATPNIIGGGKVANYDNTYTEPVALNEKGEFVVKKQINNDVGVDIGLDIVNAQIGQTIEIKEIDETGKPIKWKAVDKQKGNTSGGSAWKKIAEFDCTTGTVFEFKTDAQGQPFKFKELIIFNKTDFPFSMTQSYISIGFGAQWIGCKTDTLTRNNNSGFCMQYEILGKDTVLSNFKIGNNSDKKVHNKEGLTPQGDSFSTLKITFGVQPTTGNLVVLGR